MNKFINKLREVFGGNAEHLSRPAPSTRLLDRVDNAVRTLAGVDPSEREWRFICDWIARHDEAGSPSPTYFWAYLGDGAARLTFKVYSNGVSIRNAFTREQILVA